MYWSLASNCTIIEEVMKSRQGDGKLYGTVHLTTRDKQRDLMMVVEVEMGNV